MEISIIIVVALPVKDHQVDPQSVLPSSGGPVAGIAKIVLEEAKIVLEEATMEVGLAVV